MKHLTRLHAMIYLFPAIFFPLLMACETSSCCAVEHEPPEEQAYRLIAEMEKSQSCDKTNVDIKQVYELIETIKKEKNVDQNAINENRVLGYLKEIEKKEDGEQQWQGNLRYIYSVLCESYRRYTESHEDYFIDIYEYKRLHPGKTINYISSFPLPNDARIDLIQSILKEQATTPISKFPKLKLDRLFHCLAITHGAVNEDMTRKIRDILENTSITEKKEDDIAKILGFNSYKPCALQAEGNKVFTGESIAKFIKVIKGEENDFKALQSSFSEAEKMLKKEKAEKLLLSELNSFPRRSEEFESWICEKIEKNYHNLANVQNIVDNFSCPTIYRIPLKGMSMDHTETLRLYSMTCKKEILKKDEKSDFPKSLEESVDGTLKDSFPKFSLIMGHLNFYLECADTLPRDTIIEVVKTLSEKCDTDPEFGYCTSQEYKEAKSTFKD